MTAESEHMMNTGSPAKASKETESPDETVTTPEKVVEIWQEVVRSPDQWLTNLLEKEVDQKIAFVAGGGLPLLFGTDNDLWKNMQQSMQEDVINLAGIDFTKAELTSLGNFYRFMSAQGISLHCIDERCIDDIDHAGVQVHEHCGACAAVAATIEKQLGKKIDVETTVHDLLTENEGQNKQPIHPEMKEAHASMVVLIDLSGADVVKPDSRDALRAHDALPFNVSLPLDMVQDYIDQLVLEEPQVHAETERLISALARWNVQIARNIINGHHNQLSEHAADTQFVVDERETDGPGSHLKDRVLAAIESVDHGETLKISDN